MSYQKNPESVNSPWDASRSGYLGCAWHEKIGPVSLKKLQNYFGQNGGQNAWRASEDEMISAGLRPDIIKDFFIWRKNQDLETFKQKIFESDIDFILPWDKTYPAIFNQSSAPPAALFWRGPALDIRPWIALVGTRKMSPYGERVTKTLVQDLVKSGAGIVSGMALGVDGQAHKSCIEAGGHTVAVLGSGLDKNSIYPQAHSSLAEQILLSQGTIISEYPPNTPGLKHHFPQRNRLIAALCQATVVIEAGKDSGSVITAKYALEENRDVYAVPGSIFSAGSEGTNELISQGASICTQASDILKKEPNHQQPASINRNLTPDEKKILDLCRTATHIDDIARLCDLPSSFVISTCVNLELLGALDQANVNQYQCTQIGKSLLLDQNQNI
ncbi:MAG: DNA-processing protein DprA [Patescibacteria group bacterium]